MKKVWRHLFSSTINYDKNAKNVDYLKSGVRPMVMAISRILLFNRHSVPSSSDSKIDAGR